LSYQENWGDGRGPEYLSQRTRRRRGKPIRFVEFVGLFVLVVFNPITQ
jgi:hypothetical protein